MLVRELYLAVAAIGLFAGPAAALEVSSSAVVSGKPDQVWYKIGAFCAIKDWHPAISKCGETEESGIIHRTLTTKDGAKIKEKLVDKTGTSYTYEIIDSPHKTRVDWKSTFIAKGVSDAEAKKVISEIYKAGLDKIANTAGD
jgi:Polyketide cyclase / dehydrase and lipid transport